MKNFILAITLCIAASATQANCLYRVQMLQANALLARQNPAAALIADMESFGLDINKVESGNFPTDFVASCTANKTYEEALRGAYVKNLSVLDKLQYSYHRSQGK